MIILALSRSLDTLVYDYFASDSAGQIVWNIVFKYVLWIIPEMFIVLGLGIAMNATDNFASDLAVVAVHRSEGKMYSDIPPFEVRSIDELPELPQDETAEKKDV